MPSDGDDECWVQYQEPSPYDSNCPRLGACRGKRQADGCDRISPAGPDRARMDQQMLIGIVCRVPTLVIPGPHA